MLKIGQSAAKIPKKIGIKFRDYRKGTCNQQVELSRVHFKKWKREDMYFIMSDGMTCK